MIHIILATLVGLIAVIVVLMIPIMFVSSIFEKIDIDLEETNNNNLKENGNN